MGFIDDIKSNIGGLVDGLDVDNDGNVDIEDLKAAADKVGLGDKVEEIRGSVTDENGKISPNKARQALEDIVGQTGGGLGDIKDKLFGGK